jgi:hypothetical protein
MQVNHRDGDKWNNAASNLEYVTPRENMQHAIRTGLRKPQPEETRGKGEKNWCAKITDDGVRELRALRASGATVRDLCARYGMTKANVHKIIKRQAWRHVS